MPSMSGQAADGQTLSPLWIASARVQVKPGGELLGHVQGLRQLPVVK
jgi:hypothetical protein